MVRAPRSNQMKRRDRNQMKRRDANQKASHPLVIDAFVPSEELVKLEKRAVWDEDQTEEWRLLPRTEGAR
eukprot:1585172-Prymnesium_polylepis.1